MGQSIGLRTEGVRIRVSSSGEANAIGGSDELFVVEADEYDGLC
jgi:UDP-N-acetylmuramate-alanine ligase